MPASRCRDIQVYWQCGKIAGGQVGQCRAYPTALLIDLCACLQNFKRRCGCYFSLNKKKFGQIAEHFKISIPFKVELKTYSLLRSSIYIISKIY
jgi:hypothetical protein